MKKFFLAVSVSFCIFVNISYSQNVSVDGDLNAEQVIEKYKPALISIWMNDRNFYSYDSREYVDTTVLNGSGFIFKEEGLIGTNYHVVEDIDSLIVKTSDGTFYNAELVLADEDGDFAILRITDAGGKKFSTIDFGNSDEVKAGQEVFAIGSPLGYEYTISSGIVAAVRENEKVNFADPETYATKEKVFEKVLQITAAISPGNSGGALFNTRGEVVGITTYTYIGYGNLNFAVAINGFKKFIDLEESTDLDNNEELKLKKEESLFNSNFKIASSLKYQLSSDWYYSTLKDPVSAADTFISRKDSLNRIKLSKAEKYYEKCIELKPDTFVVYQDLLDMYVFTDNFQKAEDLYKSIRVKFDSDSLLNLLSSNLASAYSTSKDYKKAIQFYDKMLQQDTTQYYIHYQLGAIYSQMGDYKKSVREYMDIIRLDSNYTDAYIQIGKIYYEQYKNIRRAKKYLQAAYEKELYLTGYSTTNPDVNYYLGMIAVKEGRKFDAILAYMDLKNSYSEDNKMYDKRLELYKAIQAMDE